MPAKIKAAVKAAGYIRFFGKMTASLMNIKRVIQENKSTLDWIQDVAVELTRAIRSLEVAVENYVRMADQILDSVVPILRTIPLVGKNVRAFAEEARALVDKIISARKMAEKVLPGMEAGLTTADKTRPKASIGDMQVIRSRQALMPVK